MRRFAAILAALLLPACGGSGEAPVPDAQAAANNGAAIGPAPAAAAGPAPAPAATRWDLRVSTRGSELALLTASGPAALRLVCPAGEKTLLVNVPAFSAVGSEERLSFGSGGTVHALVADTRGDRERGGVSGTAPVPAELGGLIGGPVSASYGAQTSGPHPAPPAKLARAFVSACGKGAAPGLASAAAPREGSPCTLQGSKRLAVRPLRAIGTEPFWAARIHGRCVTYSHPEDLNGTRIWTRYRAGAGGGGTWSGAYRGKAFELRIGPAPRCSDGMSDRRFPLAAELRIDGEIRRGCAHPL